MFIIYRRRDGSGVGGRAVATGRSRVGNQADVLGLFGKKVVILTTNSLEEDS